MSEAIKEISALRLAEKVESGAELETVERMAAGAIIRNYARLQDARKIGGKLGGAKSKGGGAPKKNPSEWSPSYRKKMESKQRQTERKANEEDR